MPYISCDGRTYSRYDQSAYVKNCIRKEQLMHKMQRAACTADPTCRREREARDQYVTGLILTGLVLTVFAVVKLVRALYRA